MALSARAQWNTANARKANEPFDYLFGECKCTRPELDKKGWCSVCHLKRRPTQDAPDLKRASRKSKKLSKPAVSSG